MGNQCSCLTSLPQTSTQNLTRDYNGNHPITLVKTNNTKRKSQIKSIINQPLISEEFSNFITTQKGIDLSLNKNSQLPLKLHKYFMKLLTQKHFNKRREKLENETQKIYDLCVNTIYNSNNLLSKAELCNKLEKYTKDSYKSFYPEIQSTEDAIEEELIFIPKKTDFFENVFYIQYEEKPITNLKEDEEFDISSNITSITKAMSYQNSNDYNICDKINTLALSLYKGDVNIDNQPHGYGIKLTRNGEKYIGYWIKGEFTGWNQKIDKKGDVYFGKFKNGILQGKGGKYTMSSNSVYKGSFINNLKEGEGEEKTNEGIYRGSFKNNTKTGKGKMIYNSGDTYEGDYFNDVFNGTGCYKWKASGYEYIGEYKNGIMNGNGIYKWNESEYYKGEFVNGIKEGNGELRWSNGRKFIGPFKDGKPHGIGFFDNGLNFRGEMEFIKGKLNKNFLKSKTETKKSMNNNLHVN